MRIVVVGHDLAGGGAEFVTRVWCRELDRIGHDVVFLGLDRLETTHSPFQPSPTTAGVSPQPARHSARVSEVRRLSKGADVVLAMQTYPALVAFLATRLMRHRPALVVSERNIPSILLRREGKSQRVQLALARLWYRQFDGAVAISHPVAADLVSAFRMQPDSVFTVQNPALDKAGTVTDVPCRDDAPARPLTLVLPFRLVPQKRPIAALQTAVMLRDLGIDVSVLSFGTGSLDTALEAQAQRQRIALDRRGWVDDWYDHLPEHAVVLLPSYCEGFGNVLVEAASRGVPSVAVSTSLGVADAIVPGITGVLAVSGEPSDLADAVMQARELSPPPDLPWLQQFTAASSVQRLERVLAKFSKHD